MSWFQQLENIDSVSYNVNQSEQNDIGTGVRGVENRLRSDDEVESSDEESLGNLMSCVPEIENGQVKVPKISGG